ncbi:MAG: hypothetical protein JSV56_03825 [Methanomassiliicoccales archaeon]|nr:MAG: hypothetical protein JSV56_03825 [Methanomassiliicoccales archaeon]
MEESCEDYYLKKSLKYEEHEIPEGIDFLYYQVGLLVYIFEFSFPQKPVTRTQLIELLDTPEKHKRTAYRLIDNWISNCFEEISDLSKKVKGNKRRGKPPKYYKYKGIINELNQPIINEKNIIKNNIKLDIAKHILTDFKSIKPEEVEEFTYKLKKELAMKVLPQLYLFFQNMINSDLFRFQRDKAQTMAKSIENLNPKHPEILMYCIKPEKYTQDSTSLNNFLNRMRIYHELRENDKLALKEKTEKIIINYL